jgi:hypothetical protein
VISLWLLMPAKFMASSASPGFFTELYNDLLAQCSQRAFLVSPYFTAGGVPGATVASTLLSRDVRLITCASKKLFTPAARAKWPSSSRFDLQTFQVQTGAKIRAATRSLPAKIWLIDQTLVVGSVNLTTNGMNYNRESVIEVPTDVNIVAEAEAWFIQQWDRLAGFDLSYKLADIIDRFDSFGSWYEWGGPLD